MDSETAQKMIKSGKTIGRPFKKGQSGNPSGKPKGNPAVKELLKAKSVEAAQKLVELLNSENDKIAFMAAQEILNRTEGKPNQSLNMELSGGLDVRGQVRDVLLEALNGEVGTEETDRE